MSLTSVLLLIALAHTAAAQIPGIESSKTSTAPQPARAADPLGRNTPRGTITGFMDAVHRDDVIRAARYLQLTPSQSASAETLARHLSELIDRHFDQPVMSISAAPEGSLDDALPTDRERVGPLTIGGQQVDVGLFRVNDSLAGPIWLISSETLARVPALHESIKETWVERVMPPPLVRRSVFGVSWAQWALWAASIVIPLAVLRLLTSVIVALMRRAAHDPARRRLLESSYEKVRWPSVVVLTLLIHFAVLPLFGLPLTFRFRYARVGLVAGVIAVAWFVRGLLSITFERARSLAGREHTSTRSLMLLGERFAKALVVLVAIVAILVIAGVDPKTALAGFGIGGVALALGAQKTVENLLGGVFLLSDRALAIGDTCTIANRKGVVEDITLRSVRLRTDEQTLLSVPAGTLSQSNVENFATRGKILVQTLLRLRYGTTAEQLRTILTAIGRLLKDHPDVETATSRVRLINFGDRAVELELFAYVLTSDGDRFLVVREELLLQVATIVESSGSGFAQPTQFVYMEREAGVVDAPPVRDSGARDDVRLAQPSADARADSQQPTADSR
jgi:MscS family membrane protein